MRSTQSAYRTQLDVTDPEELRRPRRETTTALATLWMARLMAVVVLTFTGMR